jgi:pSer/pThr/pTyr-binding forkhead associated (FHA) protein
MVEEDSVSRRHALIMEANGSFVVRDLNSTNGTFVNGEKVGQGERVLKHGDSVRLGGSNISFIFRQEGSATRQIAVEVSETGAIDISALQADQPSQPVQAPPPPEPPSKEVVLHRYLESHKGSAVSREEIARAVWPELPAGVDIDKVIDQTVDRLRAQIEDDPGKPMHLVTVGEFGFLLL